MKHLKLNHNILEYHKKSGDPFPLLESSNTLTGTCLQISLYFSLPVMKPLLTLFHGLKVNNIKISANHSFKDFLAQRVILFQLLVIPLLKLPPAIPSLIEPLP